MILKIVETLFSILPLFAGAFLGNEMIAEEDRKEFGLLGYVLGGAVGALIGPIFAFIIHVIWS